MVLKLKKRILSLLALLILIQLSNELNVNKKNVIKMIRNLQVTTTPNSTSNSTEPDYSPLPSNRVKSSSGGLSKGGIIAIVIPCAAAIIVVGALAALCRPIPTPPIQPNVPATYMNTSLNNFNSKPPMQDIIVQQPVGVVQQPVAVVQEVPVQPVTVVQEVPVQPVTVVEEVPVA
jgi:hypothetical protein